MSWNQIKIVHLSFTSSACTKYKRTYTLLPVDTTALTLQHLSSHIRTLTAAVFRTATARTQLHLYCTEQHSRVGNHSWNGHLVFISMIWMYIIDSSVSSPDSESDISDWRLRAPEDSRQAAIGKPEFKFFLINTRIREKNTLRCLTVTVTSNLKAVERPSVRRTSAEHWCAAWCPLPGRHPPDPRPAGPYRNLNCNGWYQFRVRNNSSHSLCPWAA